MKSLYSIVIIMYIKSVIISKATKVVILKNKSLLKNFVGYTR